MYEAGMIVSPPANDPYVNLAHAIVIMAVEDYRAALKELKKVPGNRNAARRKKECEQFFSSSWCKSLTDVDMVKAAKHIRQEVFGKWT